MTNEEKILLNQVVLFKMLSEILNNTKGKVESKNYKHYKKELDSERTKLSELLNDDSFMEIN